MEFLNFGLLPFFLPLVAIPIILHLLTLHRLKTVELSTFRFLFDSYVQQRRRMKFLEWLIAALRTLFLLFVVFSIARPVVKHWDQLFGGGGSGRDVVLMVDCSASMIASTDGVSSLQRAKQAALEVVDRLGSDDRVTVYQVTSKPEEICNRFSSDAKAIQGEIESLKVTPSRANQFAAFSEVFNSSRKMTNPLIYVFSDMQTGGWQEFADGQSESLVPEETEVIVVNVGTSGETSNLAVVGGEPETRAIVGLPVTLRPGVGNFAESGTEDLAVTIYIDEKEIARKNLSIKPGETAEAEIIFTPTEPGVLRGRYEIPSDRFTDDDTYLFTLTVAPQVRVLLVNGNPAVEPLENEGVYLRTAMIATDREVGGEEEGTGEEGVDPSFGVAPEFVRSLDVQDIPEGNLNAETLSMADVVILANCGGLNADQFNLLSTYVAGGGGLLVCPGERVNPDTYNQQLFVAPQIPDEQLVSAQLGAIEGDPNDANTFERFGAIDFAHPIFAAFADSDAQYFRKVNLQRRFPVTLPEKRGSTWPLAEFSAGAPAILESRFGSGRVMLTAFPMHAKWGNLPMKPEFVPLVLRMVGYIKRRADVEGPSVVPADGSAEFAVAKSWAPASGKVTDIAGRVTPVEFQRSNSQLMGAFDRTVEKGYYTVDITGGRAEQSKNGRLQFAVNLAASESDFTPLTTPQVAAMMPNAKLTAVDASAEAQQIYGGIGNEREIWRPLIVLTFIIIATEFLLSTLSGQVADGDEQMSTGERIRDIAQGSFVGRMTGAGFRESVESGQSES